MSKRLKPIVLGMLALIFAIVMLAWYDGGREDLREIVQPVELPENIS